MGDLLTDSRAGWTVVLAIVLPLAIIALGEIQERLRQSRSDLLPAVGILRTLVAPLLAAFLLTVGSFEVDRENPLRRLIASALVIACVAAALSVVRVVIDRVKTRPRVEGQRVPPALLLAVPRLLVFIFAGWLLIDAVWGVDLSAALTALGVTSLVVSFALQDTLSGLASGMLLLSDQPFAPGDWIKTDDTEGRVVDMNWRSTRIQTRDGDLLIIPNAQLAGATIVNYDQPSRLHRVRVEVQVAFVNPPNRAKEMLLAAARATPGVLDDPAPQVEVVQTDDPLMTYEAWLWIDDYAIRPRVESDFRSLVWYSSERMQVPLPSPAQDLYLYDGVAAGTASDPSRAELRARLQTSPLLAELHEDEIDLLAGSARQVRFAGGEVILADVTWDWSLHVLIEGRCRLVVGDGEAPLVIAELDRGEVFGLWTPARQGTTGANLPTPRVVAVDDCEVVIVEGDTAGKVVSRAPALSDALNQILDIRRRRMERLIVAEAGRLGFDVESSDGDPST